MCLLKTTISLIIKTVKTTLERSCPFMYYTSPPGWFHSPLYNQYQKVNKKVYVYVMRTLYGWQVQLYRRGDTSMCELEARTCDIDEIGFLKMISLGDKWLKEYGNLETNKLMQDKFHVFNQEGVWGEKNYYKKEYNI